jgi:tetratricopeptide (TPR) repeat protein
MQQLDEAIIEYSKAITLYYELQMNSTESSKNPFTDEMTSIVAEIHANRGLALFSKGFNDEALRDFERAIQLDSSLTAAHFNRGNSQFLTNHSHFRPCTFQRYQIRFPF